MIVNQILSTCKIIPRVAQSSTTTIATSRIFWASSTSASKIADTALQQNGSTRTFFSSPPVGMGLDEFRDSISREQRMNERVGRSWTVQELRRKSFDDLHKLWYVLYKERNMILTEKNLSRRHGIIFPQQERQKKVQKSMAAIRVVLGERKRDAIAQHALRMSLNETADLEKDDFKEEEETK